MDKQLEEIMQLVVDGKQDEIEEKVNQAINDGIDLEHLINDALIAAMDVVGKRFSESIIFVPEMLVSALTMKKPGLFAGP